MCHLAGSLSDQLGYEDAVMVNFRIPSQHLAGAIEEHCRKHRIRLAAFSAECHNLESRKMSKEGTIWRP
jgi:hypothetical protein